MHRKQLGFILVVTSILLFLMVLIVLYQPYQEFNANVIKDCIANCKNEMTPSLIFSIILVIFIFVYGIFLLTHKFKY